VVEAAAPPPPPSGTVKSRLAGHYFQSSSDS
jgi:hypothetical protein